MRYSQWIGLLALAALLLPGCAVRSRLRITGEGSLADTPPGPTAVLKVTAKPQTSSKSGKLLWGVYHTSNVEKTFAERLARVAADQGGLSVVSPRQVRDRLKAAGLEPTLQPDEETLRRCVDELGLKSYLTAYVHHSSLYYHFFWSWAKVRFEVVCLSAADAHPLWRVEVRRQCPLKSDRETMGLALREALRYLGSGGDPPNATRRGAE